MPTSPLGHAAGGFNPQFMPSLPGICTLFSRWLTAASLWVHLLAVNLFAARDMYLQGEHACQVALPSLGAVSLAGREGVAPLGAAEVPCAVRCACLVSASTCQHGGGMGLLACSPAGQCGGKAFWPAACPCVREPAHTSWRRLPPVCLSSPGRCLRPCAGDVEGVPTSHSILMCMAVAPLGLLSHAVTRAVVRRSTRRA